MDVAVAKRRYVKDADGSRHLVVRHMGFEGWWARWTQHCSGCTEFGDYGTQYGPFGCEECGYTGKRRMSYFVPLDEVGFQRMCDWLFAWTEIGEAVERDGRHGKNSIIEEPTPNDSPVDRGAV